jgi:ribosomal protein S19
LTAGRFDGEMRTEISRSPEAISVVLNAYDGSFTDTGEFIRKLQAGIKLLRDSYDDLDEFKLSGQASSFMDFYRTWCPNPLAKLTSMKNMQVAKEFIGELWEKHSVHNGRNYKELLSQAEKIRKELISFWLCTKQRKELEDRIRQSEIRLENLAPKVPRNVGANEQYTVIAVKEFDGKDEEWKPIRYEHKRLQQNTVKVGQKVKTPKSPETKKIEQYIF